MSIVDVHCHNFNADDLPVKGFVKRVAGSRFGLAKAVAWTVDKVVQGLAPGSEENKKLDRLLAADDTRAGEAGADDLLGDLEDETDELLAELEVVEADTYTAAKADAVAEDIAELGEQADVAEGFGDIRRYIKWAALFGKSRLDLTRVLIATYNEVDLFCPMLVDMAKGLEDTAKTSIAEQLELQEKISRLSMMDRLGAQIHPFVGFDPRRFEGLQLAQAAVRDWGCVGVKMYPPMGYRPFGNAADVPHEMTEEEARRVDETLEAFYDWCVAEDVPITAHGNPTNYAHEAYQEFSSPDHWKKVLQRWGELRLNLGHFGGSGEGDHRDWPRKIAAMAKQYPKLYADNGNHQLGRIPRYFDMLERLFADGSTDTNAMMDRFMFGTDWYMVAAHRDHALFLSRFRDEYRARFPLSVDQFMGNRALTYLGFDDASNKNNQRLRKRYETYTPDKMPGWLAQP